MNYSELEYLKLHELNLMALEQKLKTGELKFEELEDFIELGQVTINNAQTTEIEAIEINEYTKKFLNFYPENITLDNIFEFIKQTDLERVIPRYLEHYNKQDKYSVCTDFQGLKEMQTNGKFNYLISSSKIYKDKLLTLHSPIKNLGMIAPKIEKALELDTFMRKNYERFASLSKTEKEVLQMLALGYSNQEISDRKFVSLSTVQTHRRNLKKKLDAKHFKDLLRFAQAFDLV